MEERFTYRDTGRQKTTKCLLIEYVCKKFEVEGACKKQENIINKKTEEPLPVLLQQNCYLKMCVYATISTLR